MNKSPLAPWTVTSSDTIMKDRWIDLRAEDCLTAAGVRVSPYYVLHYPDWTHTVCLDGDDRVCVVSQYRHAAARVMMELPGGFVDAGEQPLEAAMRELQEETGIVGRQWRSCGKFNANPATHTNNIHVFACRVEKVGMSSLDATEEVQHSFLTRSELRAAIIDGMFGHLAHIGALTCALGTI